MPPWIDVNCTYRILVATLLIFTTGADAVRDFNIKRNPEEVSWCAWHVVKWLSIWPFYILTSFLFLHWYEIIIAASFSKIIFKVSSQISLKGFWMDCPFKKGK